MSFTGFRLCITSADALLALALAVSVYCSPVVAANDTIEITVRVRDEAAIPKRIRMLAEKEAGSILEKAGVHVVWVDCVRPAPDSWYCPGGGPLTFGLWMQVAAPTRVHRNCLGFALIGRPASRTPPSYIPVSSAWRTIPGSITRPCLELLSLTNSAICCSNRRSTAPISWPPTG